MKFIPTSLPDVVIVEPKVFPDERGFFLESYQKQKFAEAGIDVHCRPAEMTRTDRAHTVAVQPVRCTQVVFRCVMNRSFREGPMRGQILGFSPMRVNTDENQCADGWIHVEHKWQALRSDWSYGVV